MKAFLDAAHKKKPPSIVEAFEHARMVANGVANDQIRDDLRIQHLAIAVRQIAAGLIELTKAMGHE